MSTKWLVLETPVPTEDVVAAARFQIKYDTKIGYIDILCADGVDIEDSLSVLRRLLQKIEHIGFSHGLNKIVVGIPQWRLDTEELLTSCEYTEQSGHIYPEDRAHELTRPTMILEFHKDLNPVSDKRPGFVSYTVSDNTETESTEYSGSTFASSSSEGKNITEEVDNDEDLLSTLESITLSADTFNTSSGVDFNEVDGGVTIDFDVLSAAAAKGKNGVETAFGRREGENMEGLIENLFRALHKEEVNKG
eukprot:gene29712-36804_t